MKPNPNCLSCKGTGELHYPDGQDDTRIEECGCSEGDVDVSKELDIDLTGEELELAKAIVRGEAVNTIEEIL